MIPRLNPSGHLDMIPQGDLAKVGKRLIRYRLQPYMEAMGNDLIQALKLYVWNIVLSGALFEAIAVVEVVVRNEIDNNLAVWANKSGMDWMDKAPLDKRGKEDIQKVQDRNYKDPSHGKIVADLSFGFWRFLTARRYLHTIWMPAMSDAFPNLEGRPEKRRALVERSIDRLWFLRNRIGHHEPIHTRNIECDIASMNSLLDWICHDTHKWAADQRRVQEIISLRPLKM